MADLATIDAEPLATDIIATLRRALAKAETGELSSLAIAYVYRDGSIGHSRSDLPSFPAMVGSLMRLVHKLNLDMDDG